MTAIVKLSPLFNAYQALDNNGLPISGAKLYTYLAGSNSVHQPTYTSITGTIPNSNPIIADSSGRFINSIWLDTVNAYNFVLTLADGITVLGSWDNINTGISQYIYENPIVMTEDFAIHDGYNAVSVGPLTFNPGVDVVVPFGSTYVIL